MAEDDISGDEERPGGPSAVRMDRESRDLGEFISNLTFFSDVYPKKEEVAVFVMIIEFYFRRGKFRYLKSLNLSEAICLHRGFQFWRFCAKLAVSKAQCGDSLLSAICH